MLYNPGTCGHKPWGYDADRDLLVCKKCAEKPGRILNIKNWGATGDGVTDDSNALHSCMNAAKKGDLILIPPGTFKVPGTFNVPPGVTVTGTGGTLVGCTLLIPRNGGVFLLNLSIHATPSAIKQI